VITGQIEDFSSTERFADMVLGLLSVGQRVAAVAALPRSDGAAGTDGPLADFFLGLISASRTLASHVSCDAAAPTPMGFGGEPAAQDVTSDHPGLLR
jgi:hypothetical protein